MNRKNFLSSIVLLAASFSVVTKGQDDFAKSLQMFEDGKVVKIPSYLKPGDTIGITCPSGYITIEDVQPALDKMKEWGFQVRIGDTVGIRDFTFAGSDEQRARDFQNMIDDDSVKAVMLGRGGYGAVRIIDAID